MDIKNFILQNKTIYDELKSFPQNFGYTSFDQNAIYWIKDTHQIFRGEELYSGQIYYNVPNVHTINSPAQDVLYFQNDGNGFLFDGTQWVQLIDVNRNVIKIVDVIDNLSTDDEVPSAKAVFTKFSDMAYDVGAFQREVNSQLNDFKSTTKGLQDNIDEVSRNNTTNTESIQALEKAIGDVPVGKTIIGLINSMQMAGYDDTEIRNLISVVSNSVKTLNANDTGKSVRVIANEELVKQLIPDNAQEALDTLTEIAAWIQSHPNDVAGINQKILDLETKVGTLPAGNDTVVGYIKKYCDDAIVALNIGDYAKVADVQKTFVYINDVLTELDNLAHSHTNMAVLNQITNKNFVQWNSYKQKIQQIQTTLENNKPFIIDITKWGGNESDLIQNGKIPNLFIPAEDIDLLFSKDISQIYLKFDEGGNGYNRLLPAVPEESVKPTDGHVMQLRFHYAISNSETLGITMMIWHDEKQAIVEAEPIGHNANVFYMNYALEAMPANNDIKKVIITNKDKYLTSIVNSCFAKCYKLKEIVIPDTVTQIGSTILPFNGSTSPVRVITVNAKIPPTIDSTPENHTFKGLHSDAKIYVPYSSLNDYKQADGWSTYARQILPIDFDINKDIKNATNGQILVVSKTDENHRPIEYIVEDKPTNGQDGNSPTVQVVEQTNNVEVTITDKNGDHKFVIPKPSDGFSPVITTKSVPTGTEVTITNKDNNSVFIIPNPKNGQDGQDGVSPTLKVEQTASGVNLIATDVEGTTKGELKNGTNGTDGKDGKSPTAKVAQDPDGATVTITDATGTTTAKIKNGKDGKDGTGGGGTPAEPYELIKTVDFQTPEPLNESVEPDGTPFDFDRVLLRVTLGEGQEQGTNFLVFAGDKLVAAWGLFQTNGKYGFCEVYKQNGLWTSRQSRFVKGVYNVFGVESSANEYNFVPTDRKGITLIRSSVPLVAGTKVEIYAVRNDGTGGGLPPIPAKVGDFLKVTKAEGGKATEFEGATPAGGGEWELIGKEVIPSQVEFEFLTFENGVVTIDPQSPNYDFFVAGEKPRGAVCRKDLTNKDFKGCFGIVLEPVDLAAGKFNVLNWDMGKYTEKKSSAEWKIIMKTISQVKIPCVKNYKKFKIKFFTPYWYTNGARASWYCSITALQYNAMRSGYAISGGLEVNVEAERNDVGGFIMTKIETLGSKRYWHNNDGYGIATEIFPLGSFSGIPEIVFNVTAGPMAKGTIFEVYGGEPIE